MECHVSSTQNGTRGSIYSTINSAVGVSDTDKLSGAGCTLWEGRCVSFRSNLKKSNFLFVQNGC